MKKIRWRMICPGGEKIHLAAIQTARQAMPTMHTHDFYECFYVSGGRGRHQTEDETHPLPTGNLYFVRPEHGHALKSLGETPFSFINAAVEQAVFETIAGHHPFPAKLWRFGQPIQHLALNAMRLRFPIDKLVIS